MMPQIFFEAWGFTLVHFCWQAMVLAGIYKLVDLAAPKLRHGTRYVLGLTTLVGMAGAAAATFVYEVVRLTPDAAKPVIATVPALLPAIQAETGFSLHGLLPWLDAAWLLGVLALSARTMAGLYMIHHLKKDAQPAPESLINRFNWALRRLDLTGKVRLRLHPHITGPFVIGALRSVIYLPVSAVTSLSPEQLDAVLAHELEHIRRADYAWNLVQNVIETLFFFHPAVWWLGSALREQRELCCDDAALKTCDDPLTYATALLSLEEQRRTLRPAARNLVMALNGQGEGRSLMGRIARMLGEKASLPRGKTRPHAALALPVILLVLAAFITPVAQVAANNRHPDMSEAVVAKDDAENCPVDENGNPVGQSKVRALNGKHKDHQWDHHWTLASDDGDWQAEFDSIDPDAIAEQVRADMMQAKEDMREHNSIDPDAIAAEVRADMERTKAELERQGITDHGIDPDAIAAQVRADTMKARAEMARADSIDPDAIAEQARRDAQRAKADMLRAHRVNPPAPPSVPEAISDEEPAPLAEPDAVPPAAPVMSFVTPATPVAPAKPAKPAKVKVRTQGVKVMTIDVTGPVAMANPTSNVIVAPDTHVNVKVQITPGTVVVRNR